MTETPKLALLCKDAIENRLDELYLRCPLHAEIMRRAKSIDRDNWYERGMLISYLQIYITTTAKKAGLIDNVKQVLLNGDSTEIFYPDRKAVQEQYYQDEINIIQDLKDRFAYSDEIKEEILRITDNFFNRIHASGLLDQIIDLWPHLSMEERAQCLKDLLEILNEEFSHLNKEGLPVNLVITDDPEMTNATATHVNPYGDIEELTMSIPAQDIMHDSLANLIDSLVHERTHLAMCSMAIHTRKVWANDEEVEFLAHDHGAAFARKTCLISAPTLICSLYRDDSEEEICFAAGTNIYWKVENHVQSRGRLLLPESALF